MRSLALEASIALICRAKLLRIISASAGSFQHREKFVGDLELASLQAEWRHGGEGFQLLGWIGPKVGLGALQAGVAEPQRHLADVSCRLERVHRTAMPQDVRRHPLTCDRRLAAGGDRDIDRKSTRLNPVTP